MVAAVKYFKDKAIPAAQEGSGEGYGIETTSTNTGGRLSFKGSKKRNSSILKMRSTSVDSESGAKRLATLSSESINDGALPGSGDGSGYATLGATSPTISLPQPGVGIHSHMNGINSDQADKFAILPTIIAMNAVDQDRATPGGPTTGTVTATGNTNSSYNYSSNVNTRQKTGVISAVTPMGDENDGNEMNYGQNEHDEDSSDSFEAMAQIRSHMTSPQIELNYGVHVDNNANNNNNNNNNNTSNLSNQATYIDDDDDGDHEYDDDEKQDILEDEYITPMGPSEGSVGM